MGHLMGYARVSTADQDLGLQLAALRSAGCRDERIFCDTASGELMFHIFSALAQFERQLIQERTRAGLAAARARGKYGGRKPRHAEEPRVRMAYAMYVDQYVSVADICQTLRISQATFYQYVALGRRAAERLG